MFEALCGDPEEWEVWGSGACPWQHSDLHPSVAHQEKPTLRATSFIAGRVPRVHTFWEVGEGPEGYRAQGSTLGWCKGTGKYGNSGLGGTTGGELLRRRGAVVPLETARLGGGSSLGGRVNPEEM